MGRGGIETWLMNVLRNIDREHFRFDFLVYTTQACAYDEEKYMTRGLGCADVACAHLFGKRWPGSLRSIKGRI
jgi:hypothetical protein